MLIYIYKLLYRLLGFRPVRLAVVRRYTDANGHYVGELYMEQERCGISAYEMIGASLDSLPLEYTGNETEGFTLDAEHDFLYLPMQQNTLRVGGLTPLDDIAIRRSVFSLRYRPIELKVQNRFIERILASKEI
jgi:hypothetical protein